MAHPAPAVQRFLSKIDKSGECWLWTGSLRANGYPQFRYSPEKNGYGHRFAYEHFVGPIPEGRQLHHTCEVRRCVNPAHLVPTAPKEHKERHARKHCKRGHKLKGDNLYVSPGGRRLCRICLKVAQTKWRDENRERYREYHREYGRERYRANPEQQKAYNRDYQRRLREDARRWRESQD